ncbi:MAG: hypothetical protein ABIP75_18465 [Pyrinomonadaceae bacterium]
MTTRVIRVLPLLLLILILLGSGFNGHARRGVRSDNDRYFIRVSSCDDGGRAFINGVQVVEVGFADDSNWLDITPDLTKKKNEIKFQVINKTGAITYRFLVRRNDQIVFDQTCGTIAVVGCEDNRAFKIGTAREFTYRIER